MIVFAMVDADYKFTYIDISGKGSSSDTQVYNESDSIVGWTRTTSLPFLSQNP